MSDRGQYVQQYQSKSSGGEGGDTKVGTGSTGGGLIGGILGAGMSVVELNANKKAARRAENRPKRRRLAALQDAMRVRFDRSQAMMAALAQSHLDYARLF
jgi:hypothetical protein